MKTKNLIAGAAVTIVFFVLLTGAFDMLYCLNDDMMIQSILSGTFTGETSGMSVYLSMPLSLILALFYGFFPRIPWLGVFFAFCYALCFFWVIYRNYEEKKSIRSLAGMTVFQLLVFAAVFFDGYLLVHYTVVAATVGGCGIYLLVDTSVEKQTNPVRRYLPGIFMLWLCYLIRTKVFFLLLPFLAVAGMVMILCRKKGERLLFLKELIKPVLLFAGGMVVLMVLNYGIYHFGTWKNYSDYNDARTTVYDYVGIDTSQESLARYEEAGISPEEVMMYKSYNLLLEENNSLQTMELLAACGEAKKASAGSRLYTALVTYKARALHQQEDMPYQYLVLGMYGIVLVYAVLQKKFMLCVPIVFCGVVRSVCWVYLIFAGRYPERVTMSIFIVEIFLLLIIWKILCRDRRENNKIYNIFCVLAFLLFSWAAVYSVKDTIRQQEEQIAFNETDGVLYSYMKEQEDAFFLLDVYATVNYTEYAVKNYDSDYENYLVLGGWLTESPLMSEKLQREGYSTALQALREGENVYLVLREGVSMMPEVLYNRYGEQMPELEPTARLEAGEDVFVIYRAIAEE